MKKYRLSTKVKQRIILNELKTNFIISVSELCRRAKISRETYYYWLKNDTVFREEIKEINEIKCDYAEMSLIEQIAKGNVTATIFYLKTKAKDRGYF